MNTALEHLSHSELIALVGDQQRRLADTEQSLAKKDHLIAQLQRALFGQKRERFVGPANQTALPFASDEAGEARRGQTHTEQITYTRKKTLSDNHRGRVKLPEHLPVEEIEIYPEGDLTGMVCMGCQITEELEEVPAKLYIKRYIRYKYAPASPESADHADNGEGVVIGELPERAIDKGIPGPNLLAGIITGKYVDHLPLYRQRQRFARHGVGIARSTIEGWVRQGGDKLTPLYDRLVEATKIQGYLQADETPIKVLESNKKGACHQGYYWVYHNPINRMVLFDYRPTRGSPAPRSMLENFQGYLQTDGYGGYDKIGAKTGIRHLGCWAHARRQFEEALGNDRSRAETALCYIQKLYAIERQARTEQLSSQQRKQLRLTNSRPVLDEFGRWLADQLTTKKVLPKSPIGGAIQYTLARWDGLTSWLDDGHLEIDNNLVENAIRPVALGRKNYLFAGSHKSARRAAMIYSLMASCKIHGVDPQKWLAYVLVRIMTTKYNDIDCLYPQNFQADQI